MLPAGADAVVMIEHTQEATADTIEVVRPVAPGENVVRFDEDVAAGAAIAPQGRPLRAQDVALLAAAGVVEVAVHAAPARRRSSPPATRSCRRTRAALAPGQVRDALSVSVGALVRDAGGEPAPPTIVPDDDGALRGRLEPRRSARATSS